MKQWITEQQFNELTDSQKEEWYQWCWDHKYTMKDRYSYTYMNDPKMILGFPSIGEMIVFLKEKYPADWFLDFWAVEYEDSQASEVYEGELCDALWEAVKKELHAEEQ